MEHMDGIGRFECSLGYGRINRGEFKIKLEISPEGDVSGKVFEEKEVELKWFHLVPFLRHVFLFLATPRISKNPDSVIEGKMGANTLEFCKKYEEAQTPGFIKYELRKNGKVFKGTFREWIYDYSDFDYTFIGSGKTEIVFG